MQYTLISLYKTRKCQIATEIRLKKLNHNIMKSSFEHHLTTNRLAEPAQMKAAT